MSTAAPVLEGTPLATAAAVEELERQVSELRQQVGRLEEQVRTPQLPSPLPPPDWRDAMVRLQEGYASMPEEARLLYDEAEAEAREFFRGDADA